MKSTWAPQKACWRRDFSVFPSHEAVHHVRAGHGPGRAEAKFKGIGPTRFKM